MNRTLDSTAALLGLKPRAFRSRLRELGILTQNGELASKHRDQLLRGCDGERARRELVKQATGHHRDPC